MSSPILSQDEIDALLHRDRSPSSSDELQEFLQLVAQSMAAWVNDVAIEPFESEGPYLERLGANLGQLFSDDALAAAADLGDNEMLMLMSASDADFFAQRVGRSADDAVQLISQACIAKLAELLHVPYQVYRVQKIPPQTLAELPLQPQSYLVRHLFQSGPHRFEVSLVVQNGGAFESLAKVAMGRLSAEQIRAVSSGRLLKGDKGKAPVTRAVFTPIDQLGQLMDEQSIALLEDIDLTVTVELGRTTLTLDEILDLKPQSVITLERQAGEPVDVFVNETQAAKGEVVVLEENFGVRILEIVPKSQRIQGA